MQELARKKAAMTGRENIDESSATDQMVGTTNAGKAGRAVLKAEGDGWTPVEVEGDGHTAVEFEGTGQTAVKVGEDHGALRKSKCWAEISA